MKTQTIVLVLYFIRLSKYYRCTIIFGANCAQTANRKTCAKNDASFFFLVQWTRHSAFINTPLEIYGSVA